MVSAADFDWFDDTEGLAVESCLTFVRGLGAREVARRLGGDEVARLTGLRHLDRYRDAVTASGWQFAAVADVDGGAVVVEQYGLLGTLEEVVVPLSRGTTVAVVFTTEHSDDQFLWVAHGQRRTAFDPGHAAWREGAEPDALLPEMRRLGFSFSTAGADDPGWVHDEHATKRALALAGHLTGIHLTAATLDTATFFAVAVPVPGDDQGAAMPFVLPPDEDEDEDAPDRVGSVRLSGEAIEVSAFFGAEIAGRDLAVIMGLSDGGDEVCRRVARWAREWAFRRAELTDQAFFAPVLEALRRGEELDALTVHHVSSRLDPLPIAPRMSADGSLDRGSRQHLAWELVSNPADPDPMAAACEALATAISVDNGRDRQLFADLRAAFPELA